MITDKNIIGTIGAILFFLITCIYKSAKVCKSPVITKNKAKGFIPKNKATIIMYFISPPPKIIWRLINITIIKNSKTPKDKRIELIYIFDSKKPKIKSIIVMVIIILFGTKNFLKSVYDKKAENI